MSEVGVIQECETAYISRCIPYSRHSIQLSITSGSFNFMVGVQKCIEINECSMCCALLRCVEPSEAACPVALAALNLAQETATTD
jgi:hypothetical protein